MYLRDKQCNMILYSCTFHHYIYKFLRVNNSPQRKRYSYRFRCNLNNRFQCRIYKYQKLNLHKSQQDMGIHMLFFNERSNQHSNILSIPQKCKFHIQPNRLYIYYQQYSHNSQQDILINIGFLQIDMNYRHMCMFRYYFLLMTII